VIDQILVIDPKNEYARGVRPLVEDRALFFEQRRYREQFDRQLTKQLNESEERRIPYNDILRYPENWPELSDLRDQTNARERGELTEDTLTAKQLDQPLPEVKFDNVAFSDVIDFFRDVTGANIFVNWRALEGAGIDKSAQVSTRLRNVKFSKALTTILDDVGGGTVKLSYTVDEGVITISTVEDLAKNTVTRVYDIRDLIINIPDFTNAPDFNITSNNSGGGGRGGGGGGGQNLFGGGGGGNGTEENNQPTRQDLVDSIVKLIEDTVSTETWKDNGGTVGSLRELSGQLIVTQTPENQRNLVKLLEQLRETRAIQVTIETRFLKVQRNFIESIGVDFDFQFNNVSNKINGGGPIQFAQNSNLFTQPSNLDTTLPGSLGTLFPLGTIATGLTYIDDFQATILIQATQAQQTSSQITAPRVTLFNGQRAYVLVATTQAYVSDLTPVVGSNAVGFDPTISTVQSGVLLDVQATVSADRKYVTLTLRPQLSNLLALVPFAIGGSTITPTGNNPATQPFNSSATIQQPEVQITEVRTTVSVPDGGTLLLGGQSISGEIEREAGVPVLSKIPFLKRLFTNRGMSKDDQVLLILVKPTIIIQREQEQRQFPLLTTKTNG
jgi:general secretion pathway protein D